MEREIFFTLCCVEYVTAALKLSLEWAFVSWSKQISHKKKNARTASSAQLDVWKETFPAKASAVLKQGIPIKLLLRCVSH